MVSNLSITAELHMKNKASVLSNYVTSIIFHCRCISFSFILGATCTFNESAQGKRDRIAASFVGCWCWKKSV